MPDAILFPGQGAQEVGMGRVDCDIAKRVFADADRIVGYGLSELCREGPAEVLTRTEHAQAAIYVTSVAVVTSLRERGRLDPATLGATAGLSLGEYTALWFAGVLEFEDGLRLVRERGLAMQAAAEAVRSGMVSLVGADRETAEKVAAAARGDGVLVVANLNAPGQIVLSGDLEACGRVPEAAKALGIRRAIPLNVAGAFHSPLMEPARDRLAAALAKTTFRAGRIPVYCNVTAAPVRDPAELKAHLARQVVAPVLWEDSVRRMVKDGFTRFFEPPPGRVLSGLLKKIAPEAEASPLALSESPGSKEPA